MIIIEFLSNIMILMHSGKFEEVIKSVDEFLDENPSYKTIDYYHFTNPLEELLFDQYLGDISSVKTLPQNEPLDEIYTLYAIAHMGLGNLDECEKYLKIANKINPVPHRYS